MKVRSCFFASFSTFPLPSLSWFCKLSNVKYLRETKSGEHSKQHIIFLSKFIEHKSKVLLAP